MATDAHPAVEPATEPEPVTDDLITILETIESHFDRQEDDE